MARAFPYEVDRRYLPALIPLGFRADRDSVRLNDDGRLEASLGWFRLSTDLSNVEGAHITRGYRWWTAVGARMSFVDDGLTFGTNSRAGVCIHFRERVPSVLRPSGHSALTVTVADLDGLVSALGGSPR
ncbi:MAG TPA: hypothetical protein VFV02_10495 [Acidimicrobiales bacterium]|nr:hypothetical protein [Acidimicrobiales bacterium]